MNRDEMCAGKEMLPFMFDSILPLCTFVILVWIVMVSVFSNQDFVQNIPFLPHMLLIMPISSLM
jgi:hypothetical protein